MINVKDPRTWPGLGPGIMPLGISPAQAAAGRISKFGVMMPPEWPKEDVAWWILSAKRVKTIFGGHLSILLGRLRPIVGPEHVGPGPASSEPETYEIIELVLNIGLTVQYTEQFAALAEELGADPAGWVGNQVVFRHSESGRPRVKMIASILVHTLTHSTKPAAPIPFPAGKTGG